MAIGESMRTRAVKEILETALQGQKAIRICHFSTRQTRPVFKVNNDLPALRGIVATSSPRGGPLNEIARVLPYRVVCWLPRCFSDLLQFRKKVMLQRALVCISTIFAFLPISTSPTADLRPRVFAIRDARVVTEPGKVLPKATVVIRDGLIEAVGPDVAAPADALVIDGKGLTVYPGFIDTTSNWGFDPALRRSKIGAPAVEDFAAEALAATKPDNRKGMTPEFVVSTALKNDEQADAWRRAGFTAHLIAPDGGFFTGQSALVSLSGLPPREALLRSPVGMHLSFRSVAGNDYPRVLMGNVAHARQTLLDAGHYQRTWDAYEKAGRAGKRPPLDPALAELVLDEVRPDPEPAVAAREQ